MLDTCNCSLQPLARSTDYYPDVNFSTASALFMVLWQLNADSFLGADPYIY